MKYKDNMTENELLALKTEIDALDAAYAAAAAHDAAVAEANPIPDDEDHEDPSDYAGMGWIDRRGRP